MELRIIADQSDARIRYRVWVKPTGGRNSRRAAVENVKSIRCEQKSRNDMLMKGEEYRCNYLDKGGKTLSNSRTTEACVQDESCLGLSCPTTNACQGRGDCRTWHTLITSIQTNIARVTKGRSTFPTFRRRRVRRATRHCTK